MEHSLNLLLKYIQDILNQPDKASLRTDDLLPGFRELGENLTLLADTICQLKNQLQLKTETVEMENQVLMDNIQAMDEISWSLEQTNQELRNNLALVNALTNYTNNMIFVYSVDTGQEVHTNQSAHLYQKAHAQTAAQLIQQLLDKQPEIQQQIVSRSMQRTKPQEAGEQLVPAQLDQGLQGSAELDLEQQAAELGQDLQGSAELDSEQQAAELGQGLQGSAELDSEQQAAEQNQGSLTWNMELDGPDGADIFYQVESFLIPWFSMDADNSQDAKKQAIVHIVIDETERQRRQNLIYRFAYVDPLTGLNNRRYAIEKMQQWLDEETAFTLSFIDVDYLKYCNDTFGHEQGDAYLIELSERLQTLGGELCRVGGDEFFLLQTGTAPDKQDEKLEELRRAMLADKSSGHPKSFSYATNLIPVHPDAPLEMYISDTDTKMYQYKQKYKIPLSDVVYKDDRV